MSNLQQFSNAVSKRDTGKVIPDVVTNFGKNIKYNQKMIRVCQKGLRGNNRQRMFKTACCFDKPVWLRNYVGTSCDMLQQYLKGTIQDLRAENQNFKQHRKNSLTFNFGAYYGKLLTKSGLRRMKYLLKHTTNFVAP